MVEFSAEVADELSLHVRQAAWLNAKIEQPGAQKIAGRIKPTSRLDQMRGERRDPDFVPLMPPCELPYLVGYLWEVGPVIDGGMGSFPVQETDLAAWQSNTGIELEPWESRLLRRLSREYLVQLQQAEKPDCLPPWLSGLPLAERRKAVASKIDAIFG